jgi:hypothetical protein
MFLRAGGMAQLDKLRTEKLIGAATTIQRFVRGFLAKRYYAKVQRSVLILQSAVRAHAARKVAQALREQRAAINIQRWWRGHVARKQYTAARQAILRIQAIWRGRTARARFDALRRQQAAVDLQVCSKCSGSCLMFGTDLVLTVVPVTCTSSIPHTHSFQTYLLLLAGCMAHVLRPQGIPFTSAGCHHTSECMALQGGVAQDCLSCSQL